MYGSVYYDRKASKIHWSEYNSNNERIEKSKKWVPSFFIKSKDETEFRNQQDNFLRKVIKETFSERRKTIKAYKDNNMSIYGSDLSPENMFILENWPDQIVTDHQVRYMLIDIETETEKGFPIVELADERVNLVTVYSNFRNDYTTFGLEKDYTPKQSDVAYVRCDDEAELLLKLLYWIQHNRHDIWSGWNSNNFDIAYLFNRILRILDGINLIKYNQLLHDSKTETDRERKQEIYSELIEIEKKFNHIKKLSHYGVVSKNMAMKKDPFTKEMKPQMVYTIEGVTDYDYIELDKKFRLNKRDGYKLDDVGWDEVKERKLEHNGSFKDHYTNHWENFVDYNIQDVRLVYKINKKLNYIPQAVALSYMCHCTFKDNMGTTKKIETAIYQFLMMNNIVIDDNNGVEKGDKIIGAYVTPKDVLRRGFHHWVIDVDVASLYPSLMRGINISYDTVIMKIKGLKQSILVTPDDVSCMILKNNETEYLLAKDIKQLIKDNEYHVASNNVVYESLKKKKGVLVKMLDIWYAQRKENKKQQGIYRDKALEIFNNAQEVEDGVKVNDNEIDKVISQKDYDEYKEAMRISGVYFNFQWSCKILLNSTYGCLASSFFRYYDRNIAESVTTSGRTVITKNSENLTRFFDSEFFNKKIVRSNFQFEKPTEPQEAVSYNDTDSLIFSSIIKTNQGTMPIETLYTSYNEKIKTDISQYGHEILDMENEDLEIATFNIKQNKAMMGKVDKLVRHKVTKSKWVIKTKNGKEVIVTGDHSCIVRRNGEVIEVKPSDILKTDKLIVLKE